MLRAALALVLVAVLASGCSGEPPDDVVAYDRDASLAIERGPRSDRDGAVVQEITYTSGDDRIEGYLVAPRTSTDGLPAVVFLHGAGGDRDEQLDTAVDLARRGAIALTITAPSRGKAAPAGATTEQVVRWQGDTIAADVVAARRALDVLERDERVDGDRLGLVGWSMGGRLGAIVAGVDDRVRAAVLMSVGAAPVSEYVDAAPVELRDVVREVLEPIDPLTRVDDARGALLVQAGRLDSLVPRSALQAVIDAAPDGTDVEWYPAGHALDEAARDDRLDWLAAELGIGRAAS